MAGYLDGYTVVATKSTVPVGTGDEVEAIIRRVNPTADFDVVSLPEFLREGFAVHDFFHPDRIVIGDKLELTVEVMQQKGGSETTETYQMTLPHNIDGIIINLPAYMAGLPEEAYLEEFIPAPPTEEDDEEAPNTEDDMGLGDF